MTLSDQVLVVIGPSQSYCQVCKVWVPTTLRKWWCRHLAGKKHVLCLRLQMCSEVQPPDEGASSTEQIVSP